MTVAATESQDAPYVTVRTSYSAPQSCPVIDYKQLSLHAATEAGMPMPERKTRQTKPASRKRRSGTAHIARHTEQGLALEVQPHKTLTVHAPRQRTASVWGVVHYEQHWCEPCSISDPGGCLAWRSQVEPSRALA